MAGGEFDDVSGDEHGRVGRRQLSAPHDRRAKCIQCQEGVHRAAGSQLRDKSQENVDEQNRRNRGRFNPVTKGGRHKDGRDQQVEDDVRELIPEHLQG